MKAFAIAGSNLRRTLRQRANIYFIFLFPLLLIFILGAAFGGSGQARVGVVAIDPGPLARDLQAALLGRQGIDARTVDREDELITAVEHDELDAGVVIPVGYDDAIGVGSTVTVRFLAVAGPQAARLASIIRSTVDEQSMRLLAARFAGQERGLPFEQGLRAADAAASALPLVTVQARTAGTPRTSDPGGRFGTSASTQLVLFLFVTALTSSVALIETRQLGISRRMLTTPTRTGTIIAGEGLGRFAVTAMQGLFVMIVSALAFQVDWGDPLAAGVLMVAFALVASGAGMLMGAVSRSTQQASALGILLGLSLAALGGAMMPLEFFSPTLRTVAHIVTPHAWAVDGFTVLIAKGGTIVDIAPQIAVLLAVAVVLLGAASWRLRTAVAR